jgi:phenylacetate-coenzyme A ligase PaaK-like adenylate-forming protein
MSFFDPWLALSAVTDVVAAGSITGDGLAALRRRRLAALLQAATSRSRLFSRLLAGRLRRGVRLTDLPITHKTELMAQFDDWVCDPGVRLKEVRRFIEDPASIGRAYAGRHTVWESSGSSGEPCIFVQDPHAMAVYDALEALRRPTLQPLRRWLDPWCLGERVAFVGATNGHFASTVSMARLRRLNPVIARNLHSVSFLQPMSQLVEQLAAISPTVIATYPSVAALLAQERIANRLLVPVQEIWTGGEELSDAVRAFVTGAFRCPVANSYGASEFLSLAFDCRLGHLHLNSDWAILESVDDRGQAVPCGTTGATTLLTNLANHLQPLIRYDLGDRVTLHVDPCPCGSRLPVIEVQGRCDDTLRFRTAPGRLISVPPLALSTVLESEAKIFDFQLVQRSATELVLSIRSRAGAAALQRGRHALEGFLRAQGAHGIRIDCRYADPLCGRSGKMQRVIAATTTSRHSPSPITTGPRPARYAPSP